MRDSIAVMKEIQWRRRKTLTVVIKGDLTTKKKKKKRWVGFPVTVAKKEEKKKEEKENEKEKEEREKEKKKKEEEEEEEDKEKKKKKKESNLNEGKPTAKKYNILMVMKGDLNRRQRRWRRIRRGGLCSGEEEKNLALGMKGDPTTKTKKNYKLKIQVTMRKRGEEEED